MTTVESATPTEVARSRKKGWRRWLGPALSLGRLAGEHRAVVVDRDLLLLPRARCDEAGARLAALEPLRRVPAARAPFSVVLTLWVSTMAAVGLASRLSPSRSMTTRWWRMLSHTPATRKALK